MNVLSREKQIEVIAALCNGLGIRATARIPGVNRATVGTLALRVGRGCAELHDRMMCARRGSSSVSCGGPLSDARRTGQIDRHGAGHSVEMS
jgi:hypothetical protein